jgi:type I restriction enzyme S subunit
MSRVDDLITALCPGGVEFWCLKDVARIRNGKDYKNFGQGDVPVYGTSGVMTVVSQRCLE